MNDAPLYASKRRARNFWQQYRIYRDRVELQSWLFFHNIIVPAKEIQAVEIRPSFFNGGWRGLTWGIKIDNCDLCSHVLLTKTRGFITKRIAFAPDEPEKFVEVCKSIIPPRPF